MEINVENSLIGALLLNQDKMIDVLKVVKPEDFNSVSAKAVYIIMIDLWRNKKVIDMASVASENINLATYVAGATTGASPLGVLDYAHSVARDAKLRRINSGVNAITEAEKVEHKLSMMMELYRKESGVVRKDPSISAVLDRYNEQLKKGFSYHSTGLKFMDQNYISMKGGDIWMLGAFTSTGKTAFSLQIVCNMIKRDDCPRILLLSTEMTEDQIVSRIIGNFTGVYPPKIERNQLHEHEAEKVERCKAMLKKKPIIIYTGVYELSEIEAVFLEADMRGGVDIGVIDYVQNCSVSGINDPYQTQKALANRFQPLAKETDCCLLCLSQVSNSAAKDGTVLEYKGAGEWASATDVGLMLYKSSDDEVVLSVKKNRHGKKDMHHKFKYVNMFTSLEYVGEVAIAGNSSNNFI